VRRVPEGARGLLFREALQYSACRDYPKCSCVLGSALMNVAVHLLEKRQPCCCRSKPREELSRRHVGLVPSIGRDHAAIDLGRGIDDREDPSAFVVTTAADVAHDAALVDPANWRATVDEDELESPHVLRSARGVGTYHTALGNAVLCIRANRGGRCLRWVRSVELVPFATFPLYPPRADVKRTSLNRR
jgi:hypothetical protein